MKVVALAGGVGGAKLAHGLSKILAADELAVIVNTADDFIHYGLSISPDLDTVCYTIAEKSNPATGWGRQNESFNVFQALKEFGAPDWFLLGDKDLALHLERTRLLQNGSTLTDVTGKICKIFGIVHQILPMTDDRVRTMVKTAEYGELPFQEYFVKYQFQPKTIAFNFQGIEKAKPTHSIIDHINEADLIVIGPSNPYVSINPILSLKNVREKLRKKFVIGVSPIIGGKAVKGPLGLMFKSMKMPVSPSSVANMYEDFLDIFLIDTHDADEGKNKFASSIITSKAEILLPDIEKRIKLARIILEIYEKYR